MDKTVPFVNIVRQSILQNEHSTTEVLNKTPWTDLTYPLVLPY